jgi:GT2 family glycosyltransferase
MEEGRGKVEKGRRELGQETFVHHGGHPPASIQSMVPRVSIVVLNHNQYALTRDCLRSLAVVSYPAFDVILVDNGSTDGSCERLRGEFPDVETLSLSDNLGVAGGRNTGARKALEEGADYVLFLDNDTIVSPECLTELIAVSESDPSIGAAAPAVYVHDNPVTIFSMGGIYYPRLAHSRLRDMGQRATGVADNVIESDWLGGVAILNKRELFERVGFLDEDFFPYGPEDLDWGLRVRRAGYKVVVAPRAIVWHRRLPGVARNAAVARQWARSRVIFLRKKVRFYDRPLAVCFFVFYLLLIRRILPFALHKQWGAIKELLLGLKNGLAFQLFKD